jgi:uncharacterized membrane protein YdbT with pleckstrin-like domain
VICPVCGNKPLSFPRFMFTLNPWRIQCMSCDAELHAGPIAYVWTALHVVLGLALVSAYKRMVVDGIIASSSGVLMFIAAVFALIFLTAYVIPWMFLKNMYRVAE